MIGNECWLHQIHLPWLGSSKVSGERPRPVPWSGVTGNPVLHESSERRVKLENVLHRAATGQSLSDKEPANSRYGSYGQMHQSPEGLQLILTKSGIAWQDEGSEVEIIPLLLADVMAAPVQQKFSFTKSEATHVILLAPRAQSFSAVWLLCTNAGTGDFSVDHLLINFSRRGAIRWDIKDCCHFLAKSCGEGAHGSVFSGVSLLPLYDSRRRLIRERGDVVSMKKVHNFGRVAVKIWNKPPMSMIRQELSVLQAAAGHPTLSSLLGLYCEGQKRRTAVVWLLVLEHCTGGDLFDYVRENYVSQNRCQEILMCITSGLAHLHSLNIVHRDVKAENVVLQKYHAVLIDYGISADVNDEKEMMRAVGSPGYAAPEVIAVKPQRYDEKVDVFATGVLAYFMLYRALPFWSDNHEDILNKTRACEVKYPEEERSVREGLMAFMATSLEREAEDRPSALQAFLKLQDSSPEEILKGKGGKAYRIALTGLVKLGHLPDGGGQDFDEFSEESADMSEDTSKASPTVTARTSTVSIPSVLQNLHQSAARRINSLRLPRVRPTISKVLAGLSPTRIALPTLTKRLMPPSPTDGQVLELTTASLPMDDPLEDKARLGSSAATSSTEPSTALGSESTEVRSGSKHSKQKVPSSGTVESAERPPDDSKSSPKHAPILEEDERLQSSEGKHEASHDPVQRISLQSRQDSFEFLGNVDQEHDVRMSIRYDPSDSVREHEAIDAEVDAQRSQHSDVKVPKPPADAPRIKVMDAVAPSSSPPALTPVAPSSPAPGVPKHRQRAFAVFRKLISPR